MKKILVALIVMLLPGGAGAGYYFFCMQKDEPEAPKATQVEQSSLQKETSKPILDLEAVPPEVTEYYVIERRVNVYNKPNPNALVVDTLYKGEKVSVLEKVDGWYRISGYLVYEEGGEEKAEWL
ncbi:SH3 domain-containing protein, partial [Vibrio parahaemolyticus]|nr:SH3 domain-containing protein [Vibrio parahaemolyticus]